MSSLSSEFQVLGLALDGLSLRHRVTASNLANQNVPGYKRREVSFEDQLDRAKGGGAFAPRVTIDRSRGGADANNVEPDKEVGAINRIELSYQTLSRVLAMKASMMRSAISGR